MKLLITVLVVTVCSLPMPVFVHAEDKAHSKALIDDTSLAHPSAKKEAEAVKKIQAALGSIEKPEYDESQSKEEQTRMAIEVFSKAFEKAGYNYYETIEQVVDDMKNHPEKIPPLPRMSRHEMIIMLMVLQKSSCQHDKIDCLQFYPPETRDAAQWLWENKM